MASRQDKANPKRKMAPLPKDRSSSKYMEENRDFSSEGIPKRLPDQDPVDPIGPESWKLDRETVSTEPTSEPMKMEVDESRPEVYGPEQGDPGVASIRDAWESGKLKDTSPLRESQNGPPLGEPSGVGLDWGPSQKEQPREAGVLDYIAVLANSLNPKAQSTGPQMIEQLLDRRGTERRNLSREQQMERMYAMKQRRSENEKQRQNNLQVSENKLKGVRESYSPVDDMLKVAKFESRPHEAASLDKRGLLQPLAGNPIKDEAAMQAINALVQSLGQDRGVQADAASKIAENLRAYIMSRGK